MAKVAVKISKNARTSTNIEKFYCKCGGEIKMKSIFSNGKLKHCAQCLNCGRTKRRPTEF